MHWCVGFSKSFYISPDLKIGSLAVTDRFYKKRAGKKNFFWCSLLKKNFFSQKYIIQAMLTMESKVNFFLFLLHQFLVACVVLTFLTHVLCHVLYRSQVDCATAGHQINKWKANTTPVRNTNDEKNFQMGIEL